MRFVAFCVHIKIFDDTFFTDVNFNESLVAARFDKQLADRHVDVEQHLILIARHEQALGYTINC